MNERERLADEIALREASLADAARELAQGELDEATHRAILERETAALARARAALEALSLESPPSGTAPNVSRPTRQHRRVFLVVAVVAFVVAGASLAFASLRPRQSGDSITGSISLSRAQRVARLLSQAQLDVASGNVTVALAAYASVLVVQPRNVTALTQSGWLDFSAGSAAKNLVLVREGEKLLARAATFGPTSPAPWLYLGIVAASTPHQATRARADFARFVRLHPSKVQLALASPFLERFHVSTS